MRPNFPILCIRSTHTGILANINFPESPPRPGLEHSSIPQMFQGMLPTTPKLSDHAIWQAFLSAWGASGLTSTNFRGDNQAPSLFATALALPSTQYYNTTPKRLQEEMETGFGHATGAVFYLPQCRTATTSITCEAWITLKIRGAKHLSTHFFAYRGPKCPRFREGPYQWKPYPLPSRPNHLKGPRTASQGNTLVPIESASRHISLNSTLAQHGLLCMLWRNKKLRPRRRHLLVTLVQIRLPCCSINT